MPIDDFNRAVAPHAEQLGGLDSFARVNVVKGNRFNNGFATRRGCFTTAFPSAKERNEAGLNHGSSAGCQFREVRPLPS